MQDLSKFQRNNILGGLGSDELKQIAPHLELVTLSCAEVVYEMNEELKYVYFPTTAIASLRRASRSQCAFTICPAPPLSLTPSPPGDDLGPRQSFLWLNRLF